MSIDVAILLDIRGAIDRALSFTADLSFEGFERDERSMWATYSQIIIIGEAANRVSREFQEKHADVPWQEMVSMRHRLIHGYDKIKWERVWETISVDLPRLKRSIDPLIPNEP